MKNSIEFSLYYVEKPFQSTNKTENHLEKSHPVKKLIDWKIYAIETENCGMVLTPLKYRRKKKLFHEKPKSNFIQKPE